MRLTITSIADAVNPEKERLVMKASADLDVGRYVVFRSRLGTSGSPTSKVSDAFWFPDKDVKANDLVVLYTKAGTTLERPRESGGTAHFYYWGKSGALWEPGVGYVPVLLYASQWESFKPKE